jgi:hypothetical protein
MSDLMNGLEKGKKGLMTVIAVGVMIFAAGVVIGGWGMKSRMAATELTLTAFIAQMEETRRGLTKDINDNQATARAEMVLLGERLARVGREVCLMRAFLADGVITLAQQQECERR